MTMAYSDVAISTAAVGVDPGAVDWPRVARVQVAFQAGPNRTGSDPNTYAPLKDSSAISRLA